MSPIQRISHLTLDATQCLWSPDSKPYDEKYFSPIIIVHLHDICFRHFLLHDQRYTLIYLST